MRTSFFARVQPLMTFCHTMLRAVDVSREDTYFVVGLGFPDSYWGIRLTMRTRDDYEFTRQLALFLVNAARIQAVVQEAIDANLAPLGAVQVKIEGKEIVLTWIDRGAMRENVRRIDLLTPDIRAAE